MIAARAMRGAVRSLALAFAWLAVAMAAMPATGADAPRTWRVGQGQPIARIADAARQARPGDVVEIEPGTYVDDVTAWSQDRLVLRAARCCVRLVSRGTVAEGKAIWVIKGDDVVVEGISFEGAHIADRNGAGIRHEGGRLLVRDCRFTDNDMGILTWNDPRGDLVVERSELDHNRSPGADDEPTHQIYVGAIGRFVLRESYVHSGATGHLVKSRARRSEVLYNRLTDGADGHSSYELEFPNGGDARVVGNVIEQAERTENPAVISFGAEGLRPGESRLLLLHNTIVDWTGHGRFVAMARGTAEAERAGNLLVWPNAPPDEQAVPRDFAATLADVPGAARGDYRLARRSPLAGRAAQVPELRDRVRIDREYRHPRSSGPVEPPLRQPGALQQLNPG